MKSGFDKLESYLSRYDRFVISTHESPDADGLGAEIAFHEFLQWLGKTSIIINSDPIPDNVKFIDVDGEINIANGDFTLPEDITEYAQFVLDTNDYDNIGSAYKVLSTKVQACFIIDHHEGSRDKIDSNLIKVEASSACEIIYSIMTHYGMSLSFKSAQALYAGMLFDTGSFRYPKTSAETYRIAAHCLESGANPFRIYEEIYESNSLASFALRSQILSTMDIWYGGKLIAMKLTPQMLHETGATFSEGEIIINLPLTVKGVIVSVLVKQDIGGPVKVSMRTKGDYDVARIAMDNGGGGHKNAAGFKSRLPMDETYTRILTQMAEFFK